MIWHNGIGIDRAGGTIHRNGSVVKFQKKPGFDLMCHLILGQPKNRVELFDAVYGHRADGGPNDIKVIDIMLSQKKGQFAALGLELKKERGAHSWTRYSLVAKETVDA